jgi:hypothetical protein
MPGIYRSSAISNAVVVAAIFLCSCSGRQSFSTPSATTQYLPTANFRNGSVRTATLHVTDLDGGAEASSTQKHALQIVNGSRLRIALNGDSVVSAAVQAGDTSATLEPTGEGQWTATVRFVDTSNPPVQNPTLEVKMQTKAGERVFRIPVLELHE